MRKLIMIIEDEPDVMEYLKTILESEGYDTVGCMTVKDAIDAVRRTPPDLICLDIMMPHETGISFYTRLKKMQGLQNVPVIVVSGAVQQGDFDFRSYVPDKSIPEPDCYLEKPIIIPEFMKTIEKHLGLSSLPAKGKG